MERFEGKFRTQYDGGRQANSNCTCASLAMMLNAVSDGAIDHTGSTVRDLVKHQEETDPTSPGWSLHDVDLAVSRIQAKGHMAGIHSPAPKQRNWASLKFLRAEGRGILIQGDSDRFPNTTCSGAFDGDHATYISPLNHTDGRWRLGDPICSKWRWETEELLRAYAEKFAGPTDLHYRYSDPIPFIQTPQTFIWSAAEAHLGNLTIAGPRTYLLFSDNSLERVDPPFPKRAFGPVTLLAPFNGRTNAADRRKGYLIGDGAAFFLAGDVVFVPDP
jgi:hypothetical protein